MANIIPFSHCSTECASMRSQQGFFIYKISKGGGAFEILVLFYFRPLFSVSMQVSYLKGCGPFCSPRGSEIYLPKHQKKVKKNYPKIDCRAFAFSCRSYAAAKRTARYIPKFGPFWVVQIQGGSMPPLPPPPDKNITVLGFAPFTLEAQGALKQHFLCPQEARILDSHTYRPSHKISSFRIHIIYTGLLYLPQQ